MKKIFSYILLSTALLSCQSDIEPLPSENGEPSLVDKVFSASVSTRTALSGSSVSWDSSDKVSVFDGKANRRFSVSVDTESAIIYGKAANASSYCLLYPYDDAAEYSSGMVKTMLPDTQRPLKEGFDENANLLCTVVQGTEVSMHNVCGLLKFTISSTDISGIRLTSVGGEKFAGHVTVELSDPASPAVKSATSDCLHILPVDGKAFQPGTYCVSLAPVTMASGVEIRIFKTDGSGHFKVNKNPLKIVRNSFTTVTTAIDQGDFTEIDATSSEVTLTSRHPRLFASDAVFAEYKKDVLAQKTRVLYLMHNEVIATAIRCINRAERMINELDASRKRMLNMARDAFGRIFICAYAYRFTGEKRFLDCAEDLLNQICDFPNWNPHHYLDTSTLTQAASIGYDWLYYDLSAATRAKVEKKVFEYSLGNCLTTYKGYLNPNSGWNTTYTSGLIMGGIAFYEVNPDLCNEMLVKAIPSNRDGLKGVIGIDGSDHMGTMYWRNFIKMEMLIVSALQSAYGTDFGTSTYEGYRNTAKWYLYMVANSGLSFTYGDNNESTDIVPTMFYFSALFDDPTLPYYEMKLAEQGKVMIGGVRTPTGTTVGARTYPLVLLWASKYESSSYALPEDKVFAATEGKQPVVVARTGWNPGDQYLAMKGGQADLGHGHMDAGSFCYEAHGYRWVTDFLQDEYDIVEKAVADLNCGDLWSYDNGSARWKAFRWGPRQHSTITVNDAEHYAQGNARITSVSRDETAMGGTVDLTKTLNGEVASARRTALIKDGEYLEITDEITASVSKDADVRWCFPTEATIALVEGGIELSREDVTVLLSASAEFPVEYGIWTNDPELADFPSPFAAFEEKREDEFYCGFRVNVPAGKTCKIITTIKKK